LAGKLQAVGAAVAAGYTKKPSCWQRGVRILEHWYVDRADTLASQLARHYDEAVKDELAAHDY
jgi:hypothetical protein